MIEFRLNKMGGWNLETDLARFSSEVIKTTNASHSYKEAFASLFDVAKDNLSVFKMSFWRYSSGESAIVCDLTLGEVIDGVETGKAISLDSEIADFILSQLSQAIRVLSAREIRRKFPSETLAESRARTCYVVPLVLHSELLGALCFESDTDPYPEESLRKFEEYLGAVSLAYSAVKRETRGTKRLLQMRLLHQIAERALMRLDLKDILVSTVRLLKNYFLYYNAYIFIYRPEDDTLELQAVAGSYADKMKLPVQLSTSQGCIGRAFTTRNTYYCRDARTDPFYVQEVPGEVEALSELAVPIAQGNNVLGVLDVQANKPNAFDQFDIESMETLSSEIASSIIRAYDYEILKNYSKQLEVYQMQVEHDLRISEQILNMNLPQDYASPYVDTCLYFKAHHSIGGDVVLLRSAETYSYIVVGDVSGHGISSALISTSTYSYLSNALSKVPPVETLIRNFNNFWTENFKDVGYYATLFAGRLHNLTGNLEYINCAHPSPMVFQMSSGKVVCLEKALPPIGLFELDTDADIQRNWIKLGRNDKLLAYTDGLLREYPTPGKFKEEDLRVLFQQMGTYPHAIAHQFILWSIQNASRGISSADDEVLITFTYTASPAIGAYVETIEDTIALLHKVNVIGATMAVATDVLDDLVGILEETALALLARKKETPFRPRLFVQIDFLPKKFNLAILDANLFLKDEKMLETRETIPPLEDQLPSGTLKLIKNKLATVEIKKIEKGLLFVCQYERARTLARA